VHVRGVGMDGSQDSPPPRSFVPGSHSAKTPQPSPLSPDLKVWLEYHPEVPSFFLDAPPEQGQAQCLYKDSLSLPACSCPWCLVLWFPEFSQTLPPSALTPKPTQFCLGYLSSGLSVTAQLCPRSLWSLRSFCFQSLLQPTLVLPQAGFLNAKIVTSVVLAVQSSFLGGTLPRPLCHPKVLEVSTWIQILALPLSSWATSVHGNLCSQHLSVLICKMVIQCYFLHGVVLRVKGAQSPILVFIATS
jgi:hypothetical protein